MAARLTDVLRSDRAVVLIAIQPDAETFVMPTPADYLQLRNPVLEPLAHGTIELNEVCQRLGSKLKGLTGQYVKFSCEAVFRGAVPGTLKPNVAAALRCCGLAENVDEAGAKSIYSPIDGGFESASMIVNMDGNKHALFGVKGKVSAEWPTNDYPRFKFEFLGLYVDPVYEAMPQTPCFAPPKPLPVSHANTEWELHGITTALYSLSVDIATNPELRDVPGQYEIEINTRSVSGSLEFAASRVDKKNWFQTVRDSETGVFRVKHGNTSGNIIECVASNVQLLEPKYGDQNKRRSNSFNMNIMPSPVQGEHEIAFIFN